MQSAVHSFSTVPVVLPCPRAHVLPQQLRLARVPRATSREPTSTKTLEYGSESDVANLSTAYCDDFECTSGPACGVTIRAFAKDIERAKGWTKNLFAERVVYKGGLRSFKGKARYDRLTWARDSLKGYKTRVESMAMVGRDTARVRWSLAGQLGPFGVRGVVTSTIVLNPLTGQITEHTDQFDFSDSGPLAGAAVAAHQGAWASRQNASDAREAVDSALDSLSSVDEGDVYRSQDPTDPNRFFQEKDNTFSDAIAYATFLAILWGLWQAYSSLDGF